MLGYILVGGFHLVSYQSQQLKMFHIMVMDFLPSIRPFGQIMPTSRSDVTGLMGIGLGMSLTWSNCSVWYPDVILILLVVSTLYPHHTPIKPHCPEIPANRIKPPFY